MQLGWFHRFRLQLHVIMGSTTKTKDKKRFSIELRKRGWWWKSWGTTLAVVSLLLLLKYYKEMFLTVNSAVHVNLQHSLYVLGELNWKVWRDPSKAEAEQAEWRKEMWVGMGSMLRRKLQNTQFICMRCPSRMQSGILNCWAYEYNDFEIFFIFLTSFYALFLFHLFHLLTSQNARYGTHIIYRLRTFVTVV